MQVSSGKRTGNHTSWKSVLSLTLDAVLPLRPLISALASDLKLIKNDKSDVPDALIFRLCSVHHDEPLGSSCHSSLKGVGSTAMSRKRHTKQSLVKGGLKY